MATSYSLLSTVNGRLWDISANKLQASSTIIENNNIAYSSYDGSGVIRPLLKTDTSNNVLQYGYLGRNLMTSTNIGTTIYSTDPTNPSSISITSTGAQLLGVPTAPTATIGTNTTQVATTAFVSNALGSTTNYVPPQVTTLTSGSGTYTTPTNALYITVKMVGGGGGGGGSGSGNGTPSVKGGTGGTTTFGTSLLTCNGGGGGDYGTTTNTGGIATINSPATGIALNGGAAGSGSTNITGFIGGMCGGVTPFGGAGAGANNTAGGNATSNTGSGGGAAGSASANGYNTGSGGSAGGYIEAVITSPSSSYSYSVGAGGTAGPAAPNGYAGGAGGTGVIIVTAYFSAITQTLSTINSTVVAKSDNFNYYPTFINNNTNGSYVIDADGTGALKYNPSTGSLYATKFINNITNYSVYVLPYTSVNGTVTQWVDLQAGGNFTIPNAGVWQVVLQTRLRYTAATSTGFIRLSLCNSGTAGNGEIMNQSGQSRTVMAVEKIQSNVTNSFINLGHNAMWLLNVGSAQTFPYAIYPQAFLTTITEFVNYNDSNGYPTIQATRVQEPIATGLFII
jgi:hypothetical protein